MTPWNLLVLGTIVVCLATMGPLGILLWVLLHWALQE